MSNPNIRNVDVTRLSNSGRSGETVYFTDLEELRAKLARFGVTECHLWSIDQFDEQGFHGSWFPVAQLSEEHLAWIDEEAHERRSLAWK